MKTNYFLFLILFILISLFNISFSQEEGKTKTKSGRKKKKGKKSSKLMDNGLPTPDSIRPSHVSPELLCDSCQAIVNEAVKRLGKQTKSSEVLFYLDKVCDPQRYNIYHFPPPDMKTGCEVFVGGYNDEIERVLIGRKLDLTADDIIQDLCFKTTKVCEGVDFNNIKPMDDTIMVDGEPVKIDDLNKKNAKERKKKEKEERKKREQEEKEKNEENKKDL
jgi:hypothetical protein